MNKTRKKKDIVLSLGLASMMFAATNLNAQINRGLLQNPYKEQGDESGMLRRSTRNANIGIEAFGATEVNINAEDFGSPVGNGVLILLAAGVGYATMKKKNTNNIKNERKETKS